MEPRIQYTKTSDGVSIAYAIAGGGPAVVRCATGVSHVRRDWQMYSHVLQRLTEKCRVLWYDTRGTGMSDRTARDFSLEAMNRDLEAVAADGELDRFALLAWSSSASIAISYITSHPGRVSHLITVDGSVIPSDRTARMEADFRASRALIDVDWELFTETLAKVFLGVEDPEYVKHFAEHYRECLDRDAFLAFDAAVEKWDVSGLLTAVDVPTLVIQNEANRWMPVKYGQQLAAGIRGARLVVVNDLTYQTVATMAHDFISGVGSVEAHSMSLRPSDVRTVVFTDLVGHTEMMSRLGDERGRTVLREHERITREVLKAHGGTEVKTMGDGFMASFGSVTKAVECAIALQRAFADRQGEPLSVRVGLNAGEPIEEDGDLFGATVILASRIAARAGAGEILVSDNVRSLSAGKGFPFADRGEFAAKGFEELVRVYEVGWR
jgi:class 3 adenylate cyclase